MKNRNLFIVRLNSTQIKASVSTSDLETLWSSGIFEEMDEEFDRLIALGEEELFTDIIDLIGIYGMILSYESRVDTPSLYTLKSLVEMAIKFETYLELAF